MGKLLNGISGGFSGKVGPNIGYVVNGQNLVRALPHVNHNRTERQKANSQKMTVVNEFLYYMSALLKVGFSIAARGTTKNYYNLAVSYNKKYALKGEYPDIEMDYPNVLISQGSLLPAINPVVEVVPEGLKFSWDQAHSDDIHRHNDQVVLLVYAPGSGKVRIIRYGAERSEGFETIHIVDDMLSEPVETYISFINDERTAVATSIYTGRIG
jgi:hypothetical protein